MNYLICDGILQIVSRHIPELIMVIVTALILTAISRKMFQIYQLSSYRARGVMNWLKITKFDYPIRYFALAFLSFIAMFVFVACFGKYKYVEYIGYIFFVGLSVLFIFLTEREKSKVPLKYTARMIRFNVVAFVLYLGLGVLTVYISSLFYGMKYSPSYSLLAVQALFVPPIVTAAHFVALPFEALNNYSYKLRCKKKLETMPEMIRIGITGSYGKTTAKQMLAQMLQKKYRVCYGKKSYNTPLGISRVVNNDLPDDTQIFIAEMGARFVGDIKELTEMVKPNFGVITAIGNQHLETFGSQENVIKTKYELIENLAAGGLALFNGDSAPNIELYERTAGEKMITGSENVENATAYYKNVCQHEEGVSFTLVLAGEEHEINTKLLGRHIPSLMTLCAALAYHLGVSEEDIAAACAEMEPVPHRLELIKNGDMLIIDDAYNANVEGAENALIALSGFSGKTHVIITPGLVELGKEEKQANVDLGKKIGKYCDIALLIGERGAWLKEGALGGGMSEENVKLFSSLSEAVEYLRTVGTNVAVLFENDLPDNY